MGRKRKQAPTLTGQPEPKKRHTWSPTEVDILVNAINKGEAVSTLVELLPGLNSSQIHSKISNLKKNGKIKDIPKTSIAPSLEQGS
jgi:hypothetical protein